MVFEKYKKKGTSLFKDADVLSKGYYPKVFDEIIHRDHEINAFKLSLGRSMYDEVPDNIFVFGKTGTGKTMLSRMITEQLKLEAADEGIFISTCYINCESTRSDTELVKALNRCLFEDDSIAIKEGVSFNSYFNVFCRLVNLNRGIVIIILDEVDKLKNPDVINILSRVKENLHTNRNVTIIGITNDLHFITNLNPRTKSALSQREIVFHPYHALQLADILQIRSDQAFNENIVDYGVISLCAAYSAREHGDARKAIDILKASAEVAWEENCDRIKQQHVKKARDRIERDKIIEIIQTLPVQSKFVLASCVITSLKSSSPVITGSVYSTYKDLAKENDIDVLTQRRITDLISELDMLGIVNATLKSKGKYGRTREITLNPSPDYMLKLLSRLENWSVPLQIEKKDA